MSKIKNGVLDQYGAEPFEHQQFGTAGVDGINVTLYCGVDDCVISNYLYALLASCHIHSNCNSLVNLSLL